MLLGRVLLFFLACMALLIAVGGLPRHVPSLPAEAAVGAVATLGTLCVTALFLWWDGRHFRDIGLAPDRRSMLRFVVGSVIGLSLVAVHMALVAASGYVQWVAVPSVNLSSVALAAIGYGLLACREEVAFRGYPLWTLASAFGIWGAQAIVMAVFVVEHLLGGDTWVNALIGSGLGALVFGMAAFATRGLALPIGLHAAWNFGDWMRGGKGGGGIWTSIVSPGHEAQASGLGMAAYACVMLLALAGFWLLYRKVNQVPAVDVTRVETRR